MDQNQIEVKILEIFTFRGKISGSELDFSYSTDPDLSKNPWNWYLVEQNWVSGTGFSNGSDPGPEKLSDPDKISLMEQIRI